MTFSLILDIIISKSLKDLKKVRWSMEESDSPRDGEEPRSPLGRLENQIISKIKGRHANVDRR